METVSDVQTPRESYRPGEIVDIVITGVPVVTYYTTECNGHQYRVLAVRCPGSDGRMTAVVLDSPAVRVTRREVAS